MSEEAKSIYERIFDLRNMQSECSLQERSQYQDEIKELYEELKQLGE
jgi:hypothetical protein